MIKNWKITFAFLLGSILVSLISGNINLDNQNFGEIIGEILGSLLVLFLLPLIIAYLHKLFKKWQKKVFTGNEFVTTYAVVWGILVFLILYDSNVDKQNDVAVNSSSSYLYEPKDSEYSVIFRKKPTVTSVAFPTGSYFTKGESAEVELSTFGSIEKVDFYLLDKSFLNLLDQNNIYTFFNEYCENNGLFNPEFEFKETNNEKYAKLRAYKELTDSAGKERKITIVAKVYIKGENYFVTYVSSESKDFPTPEIVNFWNSLNKIQ